jgi:MFS family permease
MHRVGYSSPSGSTSLAWVLAITFLASLGTGVFWHGLSFIAKHSYGFTEARNFVLYGVMGGIYTAGAFWSGWLTRAAGRRLSPRGLLAWCIGLQGAFCAVPLVSRSEWTLWVSAGAVTGLSSIVWPVIESYVTAGRHGPAMRRAIGWFNLTWMPATALSLVVMAPLVEVHGRWAVGGLGVASLVALAGLRFFAPRPDEHDAASRAEHVSAEYPHLLRSARVLLPVSYFLTTAITPILPFRFEELGVAVENETRLAPSVAVMVAGFVCIGIGVGSTYYAALYYAMSVGSAEVEAGGTHEALIGVGYAAGPLAGLAGTLLGGGGRLVALVCVVAGVGGLPAIWPYVTARRRRRDERRRAGDATAAARSGNHAESG